jgi:hypothetical protein
MERQIFAFPLHQRKRNCDAKAGEFDFAVKFVRKRVFHPAARTSRYLHGNANQRRHNRQDRPASNPNADFPSG